MANTAQHFVAGSPATHAARVDAMHRAHRDITTLEELRAVAQLTIEVELTTIPAYLTALYSIQDRASDAFQALRSVVMEEMLHVNQAANILIGVGGTPVLTGAAVPTYPSYLPSANQKRTPYVGLFRASPDVFRKVFMGIEAPAGSDKPPREGEPYTSISQYYAVLRHGIRACVEAFGAAEVFKQSPAARQRCDLYLGRFGGSPIEVTDEETATRAIKQIIRQGEGVVRADGVLKADESYGEYHYYGRRTDGTHGPILGKPLEPSHYVKFLRVADAPDFPDTYPIVSNPHIADYFRDGVDPDAARLAVAFNKAYSLMLRTLERSFQAASPGGDDDPYFRITLPLMHGELATLAQKLMSMPLSTDADAAVGPNAAPTFEWDDLSSFEDVKAALRAVKLPGNLPREAAAALAAPAESEVDDGLIDELSRRADAAGMKF